MGTPQEFDWVKARSECSIEYVFSGLFIGAKRDVDAMTAPLPRPVFRVQENGDFFAVFAEGNNATLVSFRKESTRIVVTNQQGELNVTLGLNHEGKCKLRINDDPADLEQWQVRRVALEKLFFPS